MLADFKLSIQTIFKVVLGTFGYLVGFFFLTCQQGMLNTKGIVDLFLFFSTKIKFCDFIEFF